MSRGRQRPPGDRRRRLLSADDRALWAHVVRDVEPLSSPGDRVPDNKNCSTDENAVVERQDHAAPPALKPPPPSPRPAVGPKAAGREKAPPSLATFDHKRVRKVAVGRIAIDARIDLHGMRQSDAHDALVGFLRRSVSRGCRTVLVITGKGAIGSRPDHAERMDWERGVLRRNVPRWLSEPALSQMVVSYTEAHIRHGGAGALYIHLRAVGRVRQDTT